MTHSWPGGHPTGWLDVPERFLFAEALPKFSSSMLLAVEPSTPILLYRAWYDVIGHYPTYVGQEIGDCVSMGFGHGLDNLQCVEIALGEQSKYAECSTEFIYEVRPARSATCSARRTGASAARRPKR